MGKYNWQQKDWANFRYDVSGITDALFAIAEKTGLLSGKLQHVEEEILTETLISTLVEEASKTSEIEGEYINREDIRSSIKNKLGLGQKEIKIHDKRAQGIVDLIFDVRQTYKNSLSDEKLFDWHLMLFGGIHNPNLRVGYWRTHDEAMQIVSGRYGREIVHFEAPPSKNVPAEMKQFIQWFNETSPGKTSEIQFAPVRAAIAHLYFESIHPFEDGNGRIGRALSEKALSQGFGYPVILSLSGIIEADKKTYYSQLNLASH